MIFCFAIKHLPLCTPPPPCPQRQRIRFHLISPQTTANTSSLSTFSILEQEKINISFSSSNPFSSTARLLVGFSKLHFFFFFFLLNGTLLMHPSRTRDERACRLRISGNQQTIERDPAEPHKTNKEKPHNKTQPKQPSSLTSGNERRGFACRHILQTSGVLWRQALRMARIEIGQRMGKVREAV